MTARNTPKHTPTNTWNTWNTPKHTPTHTHTSLTSTKSFTAGKQWRNSFLMDKLSDEEQLRHIYNTSKNKHLNRNSMELSTPTHTVSKSISKSVSLSFASGGIINSNWRQIRMYICFKSIVWLFIGVVIFLVNRKHQNTLTTNQAQKYCCQCYGYALDSMKSNEKKRRIDWSYCTKCVDCHQCELNHYNVTDKSVYIKKNKQCGGARGIYWPFFNGDETCNAEMISTTSVMFFYKNYYTYGWGALIICCLYVAGSLLLLCAEKSNHYIDSIGMLLMVYNIVVSMVCFYMIGKPYQYLKTTIDANGAYCYVDTLGELMEDILTAFIDTSLGLLTLQWIFCCCKCWTKRKRNEKYNCLTSAVERYYIYTTVICGILFGFLMLTAFGVLIYETYKSKGTLEQIGWLIIVDAILLICCFDIFCCPFCKDRVRKCWRARYNVKKSIDSNLRLSQFKPYHQMSVFDSSTNYKNYKQSLLPAKGSTQLGMKNTITSTQIFENDEDEKENHALHYDL